MSAVFDKLGFMRHLESEGTFNRPQAEKLSEAFHTAVQESVATKADIARLEARIDAMDARVDAKLAGVDAKLAGVDARMAVLASSIEASIANMKVWTVGVGSRCSARSPPSASSDISGSAAGTTGGGRCPT